MAIEYKVEVIMTPHPHDSPDAPFFWCVYANKGTGWYNARCGWQTSEKNAFQRAYEEYVELSTHEEGEE